MRDLREKTQVEIRHLGGKWHRQDGPNPMNAFLGFRPGRNDNWSHASGLALEDATESQTESLRPAIALI
jgi:hypothetical protein